MPKGNRSFWQQKFEKNTERDERKRRHLEGLGWEVMELWECELRDDVDLCAQRVKRVLKEQQSATEAREESAEVRARAKRIGRQHGRTQV